MKRFEPGDRVRVTVAGFYTGARGTVERRTAAIDGRPWYAVALDPEYTDGEQITATFCNSWLQPELVTVSDPERRPASWQPVFAGSGDPLEKYTPAKNTRGDP